MLNINLYVHAATCTSQTPGPEGDTQHITVLEPDYSAYIQPMQLRRMSKAVRMGIGTANACLDAAEKECADALVVGTTMGCLQDTENFLRKMVSQDEKMLTPTSFIQSTHNTVAGQIALSTGCLGYNNTISQHGHSFEGALVAAALYLNEHPEKNVLCGGVDEWTGTSFWLMKRAGLFKKGESDNSPLLAGEGAGFLFLKKEKSGASSFIRRVLTFRENDTIKALDKIAATLEQCSFAAEQDALYLGMPEEVAKERAEVFLNENASFATRFFKKETGEYGTAIAVAICHSLQENRTASRRFFISNYCADWSLVELEVFR